MRPPSENLRSRESTFHSMSVGGRLVGLLKKTSYSIFEPAQLGVSSTFSFFVGGHAGVSKSTVYWRNRRGGEVTRGHRRDGVRK